MNLIKYCREQKGFSQKQVAIELGVAAPTVSQWESEIKYPSSENLIRLADLFGVSVDFILGRVEEMRTTELNADEIRLVNDYRSLNSQGREYIRQTMYMTLSIYKKSDSIPVLENNRLG